MDLKHSKKPWIQLLKTTCIGGGSNALGLFTAFIKDESVAMYGVNIMGNSTVSLKNNLNMHLF